MIPNLENYPNYIAEKNQKDLRTRKHALGKLSIYSSDSEPTSNHEEILASKRYRALMDDYARATGVEVSQVHPMIIMRKIGILGAQIMHSEHQHKSELIKIAEEIVRSEYNIDDTEVIFDLEIMETPVTKIPDGCNKKDNINPFELEEIFQDEILAEITKRRIMNALMQGAAKKAHFMFHLAGEQLNDLIPDITKLYQETLLSNDLLYYFMDDTAFSENFCEQDIVSSYVKLNFDGDIPVIEAKAFSFPILVHEMVKGVLELLATQGQPEDEETAKTVLDLCDLLKAEIWCCRLGPEIWTEFHQLIDIDHYDIKKLIISDIFKKPAEEFNSFFYNVLNNKERAKRELFNIGKKHRESIMNHNFDLDF